MYCCMIVYLKGFNFAIFDDVINLQCKPQTDRDVTKKGIVLRLDIKKLCLLMF